MSWSYQGYWNKVLEGTGLSADDVVHRLTREGVSFDSLDDWIKDEEDRVWANWTASERGERDGASNYVHGTSKKPDEWTEYRKQALAELLICVVRNSKLY